LESLVRAKIVAAGVYGMEMEIIAGQAHDELRAFAERLQGGELDEFEDGDESSLSGAAVGDRRGRSLDARDGRARASRHLRRNAYGPQKSAPDGYRYWRYVEFESTGAWGSLVTSDLTMLRRIDPAGTTGGSIDGLALDGAWHRAAESMVAEHNARSDPRRAQESIGPAQKFSRSTSRPLGGPSGRC
jgi:hypothetical protein